MVEDGLPLEDAKPFEAFMARCADIAPRANCAAEYESWGRDVCAYLG
jgi:hypothetical protein